MRAQPTSALNRYLDGGNASLLDSHEHWSHPIPIADVGLSWFGKKVLL